MGKTIDKKVVEMSFDNKNFENNVKTSMSTIDKLKSKLNFSGMSKGLDELSNAANRVNFNEMSKGIDNISLQFNSLYSVADQTMRRITNSVIDFGLNIGRKLIIDPKKSGFNEYELKMGSIQTIMASTGESLEKVNEYLDKLNKYSDQTIYSFQDMTSNIGKFTNAGVKLEDAVNAIKGVSNEAAISGANANEASRAMYNFAQALSAGYVKLIDWKSIENANMATVEFKNQLIQTAVEMGTLTDVGDGLYQTLENKTLNATSNFNETLQDQWMTSEVLIETLKKYSDETTDIGIKAKAAAQDVKTFSMLIDTLSEAVQSGWAQSFQIIFGDFNEAKKLWTSVSNVLGGVIENIAAIRNKYLNSFLGRTFTKTYESMVKAFSSVKDSTEGLKEAVKTVADYTNLVDEIISGIWGNGQARWSALSEAGYDWAHAQNLVNERLGFSLRRETQYKESVEGVEESTQKLNDTTEDFIINLANAYKKSEEKQQLNEEEIKYLETYNSLTKKQQNAIKEVVKLSNRLGMPVKELLHNMDEMNGRWLLFQSFGNIGSSIITIFKAIGKAWVEVFPPEEAGKSLFNLTVGFYKLTRVIKDYLGEINDSDGVVSNAEHLLNIFKGLFSIIGLVGDVIKGVLSVAFKTLSTVLGLAFKPGADLLSILDSLSRTVYNNVTAVRKWIREESLFGKVAEAITKTIIMFVDKMKNFIRTNETAQKILNKIKEVLLTIRINLRNLIDDLIGADGKINEVLDNLFGGLGAWFDGLKDTKNIPMYIISGLISGLTKGISGVYKLIISIAETMIKSFNKTMGINSPSKVFFGIGKFIMLGLILGITSQWKPLQNVENNILGNILNVGMNMKEKISDIFKQIASFIGGIEFKKMFALALGGSLIYLSKRLIDTTNRIIDVVNTVTAPVRAFANMLNQVGSGVNSFLVNLGTAKKIDSIKSLIKGIALSMLMIAASMYIISKIEPDRLIASSVVCGIMIVALGSLYVLIDKLANGGTGVGGSIDAKAKKATLNISPIIGISIALLAMAIALKKLASIDSYSLVNAIKSLIVVIASMSLLLGAIGEMSKLVKINSKRLLEVTKSLKKMASSLLIMLLVVKLASMIKPDEVKQSLYSIGLISAMFAAFILLSKYAGKNAKKAAVLISSLSFSLLALLGVVKIASMFNPRDVARGMVVVSGAVFMMSSLIGISAIAGSNTHKAALLVGSFGLAMLGISIAMKIISTIPNSDIKKGIVVMSGIGIIFMGLIAITKIAGDNAIKAGTMLLFVAGALGVLAGVIFILSSMDVKSLVKGTAVISVISLLFIGLIKSTKDSKDAVKSITGLLIAMSILLSFVIALSFIKPKSLLAATSAVSAIMLALTLLVKSTSKLNVKSIGTLAAVSAVLLVTLGILTYIIKTLSDIKPQRVLASSESLSLLLLSMTGVLVAISLISTLGGGLNTVIGVGLLTLLSVTVLPILVAIITKLSIIDPKKSISTVQSLSLLLLSMTGVLGALTIIGIGGPAALIGIGSLLVLIGSFGTLLSVLGSLNDNVPDALRFIQSGIPVLVAIGNGIGSFVGAIISGFGEQMLTLLPALGNALSGFMLSLKPFIEGSKLIDKDIVSRIGSLSGSILLLSAAEFISNIANILSGNLNLTSFGKELSSFMLSMEPFINGAKQIKPEVSKSIKNLSDAIMSLTASKFIESIPLIGKKSFEEFGSSLSTLGDGLSEFSKKTEKIKNIDNVKIASDSLKLIAEAASTIPNTGGMLADLVGDNKGEDFSKSMKKLASGLVSFVDELDEGTFTKDSLEKVKIACSAIKKIAKVASEIPNTGGMLAEFVGDNDLSTFSSGFETIGEGVSSFINELLSSNIKKDNLEIVDVACSVIKKIAKVASEIPNTGGVLAGFIGDNDLSTFSKGLPDLGKAVSSFINNLKMKGKEDQTTLALNVIKSVIKVMNNMEGVKLTDSVKLSSYLKSLSSGISDFMNNITKMSSELLEEATEKIQYVIDFTKDFKTIDVKSINNLANALKDLGNKGIKGFISSFENQDYRDKVNKAAKALGNSSVKGLKTHVNKDNSYQIGEYFVKGFSDGIEDYMHVAIDSSTKLGKKATKALKDSTKEKSPSKLTYEMGKFFDLGFVNGIIDYSRNIYKETNNIGEKAKFGMSDALSKMTNLISSDSLTQPTITPVLDLSNIESGANRIGSLFENKNVGIGANINAISTGLKIRNQNAATNNDVVNAIDKLKTTITEQKPGNTYNLNGISYNDDSPISNAISDLIKAIEIEGRI